MNKITLRHRFAHLFRINRSHFSVWIETRPRCAEWRPFDGRWVWDHEDRYFVGRKCDLCGQVKGRTHLLGTDFPLQNPDVE
jgi:hypothetical protein